MTLLRFVTATAWLYVAAAGAFAADGDRRVIIYGGAVTDVTASAEPSKDVWLTLDDLTRATKFQLKPEGVCTATLCFPLPAGREKEFVAKRGQTTWFNLSAFARLLKQPVAHNAKHGVWYFGPRPDEQNGYVNTLTAPNFTLTDLNGIKHSLSDFRGKKVLLITWASW